MPTIQRVGPGAHQTVAATRPENKVPGKRGSAGQTLKKPAVADSVKNMNRAARAVIQEGWGSVRSQSPVEALRKPPVPNMVEALRQAARDVIEGRSPAVQALRKPAVVDVVGHMRRAAWAAIQQMQGRVRQRSPGEALEKPAVVDVVSRMERATQAAVQSRQQPVRPVSEGSSPGPSRIDITV